MIQQVRIKNYTAAQVITKQIFLDRQEDILEIGSTSLGALGYTALCMEWLYGDQDYSRKADNS